MNQPVIEALNLCHEYPVSKRAKKEGRKSALGGVSFQVGRGEMFSLLGPNGSGKTTLFRILSTALFPTSGDVRICGYDLRKEDALIRKKIGIVFQSPSLDARLKVRENLMHHGYIFGLCGRELRMRCDEMMEQLKITPYANEISANLSGGLKRRTELAKGLLHKPEVLLLDEPSTGLDPGARLDLWEYLTRLRRETGVTILVTTHLMDEAEQGSTVAILREGLLVGTGSPDELKREVRGNVIAIRSPDLAALKQAVEKAFKIEARLMDQELQIEHAEGASLIARLAEAFPGMIESVTFRKPTLEDVFVHYTGHRFWIENGKDKV